MSEIITVKVLHGRGYHLATNPAKKKGLIEAPELEKYIGKTIKIQTIETEVKEQGVVITETPKETNVNMVGLKETWDSIVSKGKAYAPEDSKPAFKPEA